MGNISAMMSEWRVLSVRLSEVSERDSTKAQADLRDAWDSVWALVFRPKLEQLSKACSNGKSCRDSVQLLRELGTHACLWLDGYKLSGLAPAEPFSNSIPKLVEIAHAFANTGSLLVEIGFGCDGDQPKEPATLGCTCKSLTHMRTLTLKDACPSLAETTAILDRVH